MKSVASIREKSDAKLFSPLSLRHHGCTVFTVQRSMLQGFTDTSVFLTYL